MLEHVFSSYKVGNCEIPNRFVVPAMVTNICKEDGLITDRYIAYMAEKAKGGYGLLITEDYSVTPHGKGYARIPGFWKDEHIEGNKKLTSEVHKYGSKIFCQMYHPGQQATRAANGGVTPWTPSPIKDPVCQTQTREMTVEEIHQLVKDFGSAARRCKESGFDGIEIHAGHGYLIANFLSPWVNKRNDEYGGCFENRVRFLDEIYLEMRKNVGEDFPIQVRFSGNEYVVGGRTEAESYQLALHLEELGVDALNISNGAYSADIYRQVIASMFTEHAVNMNTSAEIKKMVNIPVMVANRINNPNMADMLIKTDKADFVCIGRGSLTDPYMPQKAKEGRFDEINYCLGCLQGCGNSIFGPKGEIDCLVNPRLGLEYKDSLDKVENTKNVMIVGGGPAGLMAARTAAQKGHKVDLYEATNHFGGAFRSAAFPMGKGELSTLVASYRTECEKLGVNLHLNTPVDEALIKEVNPDSIILATGSKPLMPPITGINNDNVVTGEDILYGLKEVAPAPTVVCGGGEVGGEVADYIATSSYFPVTILEMQNDILNEMPFQTKGPLLEMLNKKNVQIITGAKVKEITENTVTYEKDGQDITIPAGTVVSAFGYKAYNPLEEVAKELCDDVHVVESAVKAGNAMVAIKEGYEAALNL